MRIWIVSYMLCLVWVTTGCRGTTFSANTPTKGPATPTPTPTPTNNKTITDVINEVAGKPIPNNLTPCSTVYQVPATANPYLAGVSNSTTITYTVKPDDGHDPIDRMPGESPVLVAPMSNNCITTGASLYFSVTGSLSYAASMGSADGDGFVNQIVNHQLGARFGKSDVKAPIASLVGVFLTNDDPSNIPAPPTLDFSTDAERNYETLQPTIGQVFFIGTGKTQAGAFHKVVVPAGATRLYFAIMDAYQWNNNIGGVSGSILVEKK